MSRRQPLGLLAAFVLAGLPGPAPRFSCAHGVTTRAGADFDNYIVAWQVMWGGRPPGGS